MFDIFYPTIAMVVSCVNELKNRTGQSGAACNVYQVTSWNLLLFSLFASAVHGELVDDNSQRCTCERAYYHNPEVAPGIG